MKILTGVYMVASGLIAEPFADFIKQQSGVTFALARPFDYGQFITKVILGLGALAAVRLIYRYFSFLLFHRNTWAMITIVSRSLSKRTFFAHSDFFLGDSACHDFWAYVQPDS
jgi:hypothetical protein